MHEYKERNPLFEMPTVKGVLNKAEKALKDKYDGKPDKPPGSGYSLFSQIMLRQLKTSDTMNSKEKMIHIAKRWKELSQGERDGYSNDAQVQMAKYADKFESYLQKLPEDERAKVAAESRVRLPSVKKLKQLEQNRQEQVDGRTVEDLDKDHKVNEVALKMFQQERITELQASGDGMSITDLLDKVFSEWKKMKTAKKGKYLKKAAASIPMTAVAIMAPVSPTKSKKGKSPSPIKAVHPEPGQSTESHRRQVLISVLRKSPESPGANSGYALFTQKIMPTLSHCEPKTRLLEVIVLNCVN